ncbi:MAG: DinB family protein [Saprospiraceae bacterium]|nr:DinB family protein [Saprospiraceae bacterium]
MKKSELKHLPEYFDRYINQCDDIELLDVLRISQQEIQSLPMEQYHILGERVYSPGKWTVKEVFQHIIDTERIFNYRVLCYARDEKEKVLSFDEDGYAAASMANGRSLEDIIHELTTVQQATYTLFNSFTTEMLDKMCIGFKGLYSVGSAGFIIAGHQRWHLNILQERYLPLLNEN